MTEQRWPEWQGRIGRYYVHIWIRPWGNKWSLEVELAGFDTHRWTFGAPCHLQPATNDSVLGQVLRGVAWAAGGGRVRLNTEEADQVLARIAKLGTELQIILGDSHGQ